MAEHRPFPPSPRRRALARGAGLHAASPLLVGALACVAVAVAIAVLGRAAGARVGSWIAAAARGEATLGPGDAVGGVLELAAPILAVAALAAIVVHFAQTRAAWLPHRRITGAPGFDRGAGARMRRATFELAAAAVIGCTVVAWLWLVAPRLAALPSLPLAGALFIAGALTTFAIAWVAIGVIDALLRHAELARALRMTDREKREDDRLAGADPRWRGYRTRASRADVGSAVAGATVLVLGDDLAIAVAWDPVRRPVPVRTASGRRARATQLLGLARRHRIAVHRDVALASALEGEGPIAEQHWPRVAEIVAAVRAR